MRWTFLIASLALLSINEQDLQIWMENAFYPALLSTLVIASLGLPLPEDIPLILAGVVLRTQPHVASPLGTLIVAMVGIMSGDLILYTLGRRWGPDVLNHRWVNWIITADRYNWMKARFHRYGVWMCFFGRFFMGVRAAMCITAGATHFPYWRFFLADFAGALLSVPLFIALGYWFAGALPQLQMYVEGVQGVALVVLVLVAAVAIGWYKMRRFRRKALHTPQSELSPESPAVPDSPIKPPPPMPSVKDALAPKRKTVKAEM